MPSKRRHRITVEELHDQLDASREEKGLCCPKCNGPVMRSGGQSVAWVRDSEGGRRRKRVCAWCQHEFCTTER